MAVNGARGSIHANEKRICMQAVLITWEMRPRPTLHLPQANFTRAKGANDHAHLAGISQKKSIDHAGDKERAVASPLGAPLPALAPALHPFGGEHVSNLA